MRQLNGQLDPVSPQRLRVGVGDGIADFDAIVSNAPTGQFASGWNDIQNQLTAESGALAQEGQSYVDAAGNAVQGVQNTAQGYVDAAGNYVQGAQTAVQGLYGDAGNLIAELKPDPTATVAQLGTRLDGAKAAFVGAYEQITAGGLAGIVSDPVAAAKQFVLVGQSVAGAISTISGLIKAAQSAVSSDKEVIAALPAFTGVMLSLAAAAGLPTAGIGTAVVYGLTELITLLYSFFAPVPPSGQVQVCPNVFLPPYADQLSYGGIDPNAPLTGGGDVSVYKLSFTVGCVGAYVGKVTQTAPGAAGWRHFPDPNDPNDAAWFYPIYWLGPGPGGWRLGTPKAGVFWSGHNQSSGNGPNSPNTDLPVPNSWSQSWQRPIDCAFPTYRYLECEMFDIVPGNTIGTGPMAGRSAGFITPVQLAAGMGKYTLKNTLTDFQKAFFAAWKANQELSLNGLTAQDDSIMFLHLLSVWNAAHKLGAAKLLTQKDSRATLTSGLQPSYPIPCGQGQPKYYETLITDCLQTVGTANSNYFQSSPGSSTAQQYQGLILHGGDVHSVPVTTPVFTSVAPPAVSTSTRLAIATGATAAVAVAGAVAYSYVNGIALSTVYKGIWSGVKRIFVR